MRVAVKKIHLKENQETASYEGIHKALLSGLITNVALKNEEKSELAYLGTRNLKLSIFPGSGQSKKKPKWIMAAQMLETGYDRITLLGLILADKQKVNYSHVDAVIAREVFIRSALVEGAYEKARPKPGEFFLKNRQMIRDIELLEAKSRRRDILINEEALVQFYEERVANTVINLSGFEHWRKQVESQQPEVLVMQKSWLMQHAAQDITEAEFPNVLSIDGMELPLTYHFEPGSVDDGVSIGIPVSVLHVIPKSRLEWLVPGLLREKCIALVKGG